MSIAFLPNIPRAPWSGIAATDWNDWRWQLRHAIRSVEDAEKCFALTPSERKGIAHASEKFAFAVTPYFFNLIDAEMPECPIRRQVVPRAEEMLRGAEELDDPCGEDSDMVVPGLVHRYPDRVLLLATNRCAAYCRYCTRSRIVSGVSTVKGGRGLSAPSMWLGAESSRPPLSGVLAGEVREHLPDIDAALDYLRKHEEVRDVLVSGGDPFLLSDERLDDILSRLRGIPHIEIVRIGTRVPVVLPQRVTPELCAVLAKHHPLWLSVHVNHPRELTAEARTALTRLADAGVPLGNQSVLLKGVNDDPAIMRELVHKLLQCRVRPYYLYQCDLVRGSAHLRASVARGIEIIAALRGHTTGYAVPQFVIDAPGGGGKVPVFPQSVVSHDEREIVFRNFEGEMFSYPEC